MQAEDGGKRMNEAKLFYRLVQHLRRIKFTLLNFRYYPKELNRRAAVEQELWDCYRGKNPLPDKAQCRDWALRLGIPDCWR